jgi:hypothetical protein
MSVIEVDEDDFDEDDVDEKEWNELMRIAEEEEETGTIHKSSLSDTIPRTNRIRKPRYLDKLNDVLEILSIYKKQTKTYITLGNISPSAMQQWRFVLKELQTRYPDVYKVDESLLDKAAKNICDRLEYARYSHFRPASDYALRIALQSIDSWILQESKKKQSELWLEQEYLQETLKSFVHFTKWHNGTPSCAISLPTVTQLSEVFKMDSEGGNLAQNLLNWMNQNIETELKKSHQYEYYQFARQLYLLVCASSSESESTSKNISMNRSPFRLLKSNSMKICLKLDGKQILQAEISKYLLSNTKKRKRSNSVVSSHTNIHSLSSLPITSLSAWPTILLFLRDQNFNETIQQELYGYTGDMLLDLVIDELKEICGNGQGLRLYKLLHGET